MILYNKKQLECIHHPPSPLMIIAGAGTGKTTTLLNLVDKYLKKTDPDKIGYFAFTQKAA